MKFEKTEIPDVFVITPKVFEDGRGFFFESYRKDQFLENGIDADFVQDNHSSSTRGTLRGLHYQVELMAQAKMIRVVRGEIFDVALDIRPDSPSFGRWVTMTLSAENRRALYIPKGFAHGFLSMSEEAEVLYMTSQFYSPEHERGILWNDPELGIPWPKLDQAYAVSEKDLKNPRFADADIPSPGSRLPKQIFRDRK